MKPFYQEPEQFKGALESSQEAPLAQSGRGLRPEELTAEPHSGVAHRLTHRPPGVAALPESK